MRGRTFVFCLCMCVRTPVLIFAEVYGFVLGLHSVARVDVDQNLDGMGFSNCMNFKRDLGHCLPILASLFQFMKSKLIL